MQREQALFTAHRAAFRSEIDALNQLKSLLNGEVGSLADRTKNLDQALALLKQELSNTTSLVQRDLAIAPREYELRQTELETQGRRLDLDTARTVDPDRSRRNHENWAGRQDQGAACRQDSLTG
jgi:polysaccharide biosynthesis/export protein ExoF